MGVFTIQKIIRLFLFLNPNISVTPSYVNPDHDYNHYNLEENGIYFFGILLPKDTSKVTNAIVPPEIGRIVVSSYPEGI